MDAFKEAAQEIARIAAVMGDNALDELYNIQGQGYMQAVDTVAQWAVDLYQKHKNTIWEDCLYSQTTCACWDDVVIEYAQAKLKTLIYA
mgnify:FL=1